MRFQAPQLHATACCYHMMGAGYQPATVLNVGVGSCPELPIWKWLLPQAWLFGIDARARPGRWNGERCEYLHAIVSDGSNRDIGYCRKCQSIKCEHAATSKHRPKVQTLDEIAIEHDLPRPYFLWLDIEGGELEALRGAQFVLANCAWLSLEVHERGDFANVAEITDLLRRAGFRFAYQYPGQLDRLFKRGRHGKLPPNLTAIS